SNLMIHFPALFAIISVVSTRAGLMDQPLDRAEFQRLLFDGEVLPKVVHVWLSAVIITSVVLLSLLARLATPAEQFSSAQMTVRRAALAALLATLLQVPTGLWIVWNMPESSRQPLLGGDWVASGLFFGSILLAVWLMQSLAGIALEPIREPFQ